MLLLRPLLCSRSDVTSFCGCSVCVQAWTQYGVEPDQVDKWVENLRKVFFVHRRF